uniref:Uncharacterized protein n=1 Tax=Arundo donax TaxID=35708 RepID=A0A0A9B8P9_ARUDO
MALDQQNTGRLNQQIDKKSKRKITRALTSVQSKIAGTCNLGVAAAHVTGRRS